MTTTTRDELIAALRDLPEQTTFEEAIERLAFLADLRQRVAEADAGNVISHEEAKRRIDRWLK